MWQEESRQNPRHRRHSEHIKISSWKRSFPRPPPPARTRGGQGTLKASPGGPLGHRQTSTVTGDASALITLLPSPH